MEVTTPLRDFPGVGDARAKSLERLGLRTAGDLTAYFPRGYEDRREQYTIAAAPLDVPVCIPVLLAEEPRRMNIRRGLDVTRMKVVDGASAVLAGTGMLTLAEESRPMAGGLILRDNNVETNCSFEVLIHLQRDALAAEVAKTLFD